MKSRNVESASRAVIALLFALAGTVLVGCSNSQAKSGFGGSDDPGGGGSMEIVSCSLGCNSFLSPQVTCNVNDVFVNEEIRIEFSQPVDISSLGPSTFRVQETSSGSVPPGTFSIDPSNPRGIIYRPLLSFDSMGSPTFGLTQGLTYSVFLPGANLDEDGPYILSTSGRPLLNRLQCFVTAASGINDLVPGAPSVSVDVNVVETDGLGQPVIDPMTGIPMLGARVNADGAVEVHRRSDIVMTFNDVMNPASLVNPVTGTSPTIRVFLDPDGDVADPGDRLELFGRFEITIDQDQLTTIVRFDPDTDFPSAGTQPTPRRIVVELPNSIVDLGGNPLNLDNTISFVSERLAFPPAVLVEDFGAALAFDDGRSGAEWGPVRLAGTRGGGSGRLGDLVVAGGTMLTLYTDGMRPKLSVNASGVPVGQEVDGMGVPQFVPQLFGPTELVTVAGEPETTFGLLGSVTGVTPNIELDGDSQNLRTVLIDNYDPADSTPFDAGVPGSGPAPGQSTYQVTDGIFEFASVRIDPGSVLRILGPHPPRLYSRGEALIRGRIEVRGVDVELPHDSSSDLGGLGAIGGPGGGRGGNGGQRPDGGVTSRPWPAAFPTPRSRCCPMRTGCRAKAISSRRRCPARR